MTIKFKLLSIAAMTVLVIETLTVNAYAATGNYDFYPIQVADTIDSHAASKAGGPAYENCAYITLKYFSKEGSVNFGVEGNGVTTERINIAFGGVNVTRHPYYTSAAPSGGAYYVGGRVSSILSGTSMRVTGVFTP